MPNIMNTLDTKCRIISGLLIIDVKWSLVLYPRRRIYWYIKRNISFQTWLWPELHYINKGNDSLNRITLLHFIKFPTALVSYKCIVLFKLCFFVSNIAFYLENLPLEFGENYRRWTIVNDYKNLHFLNERLK